ncbi:hypothetical protein B4098_2423 [Heyndrickxia coagulans]|uniref:Uncharacterized protein n=1 Tax=Heyndrickxia coagulans TaxID=1398 RepID=A0A150JNR7_HEYCO|nr:hypothetical protein B4098_2423 [Heyndrickxia coagulans]
MTYFALNDISITYSSVYYILFSGKNAGGKRANGEKSIDSAC